MTKTLVVGASGTVGKALGLDLQQSGHQVVRATSKQHGLTEGQVHLDVVRKTGLDEAFVDIDKAFFLSPLAT